MNNQIKNALLNGRLVLLFGAGASIGSKNKLNEHPPLGGELSKILAEEIGEEFNGEALADVYSAAKAELGDHVFKILETHYKHCTPSREFATLLKYPFFRIYTLNIDDAFEKAAHQTNRIFNVKHRSDPISEVDQYYKTLDYIKLNGDISYTSKGFIFSAQEYGKGSFQEPIWYSELAKDYYKYTFLFVGTQLKEPLFYHQIEKYKAANQNNESRSYLLTPSLSPIQKRSLANSNIDHLAGTLYDFTNWLETEFDTPPSASQVASNVRPELNLASVDKEEHLALFSGVIPVHRSSLTLIDKQHSKSKIREFYKGFKPSWSDILDGVPAELHNVNKFYKNVTESSSPSDLHLLFGSAGCGKTTALKQLALKLSDLGTNNVYFINEQKENFNELLIELNNRNNSPFYVFLERVSDFAAQLADIIKFGKSENAIFISAENPKIWKTRVQEHLEEHLTTSEDISHITHDDADNILSKLEEFGNWTRLSKMSPKKRKVEILKKSKNQLLIGLIEATSGEGYNEIIQKDYKAITCPSERALLLLAGLATTSRVPANEATITRALSSLKLNPHVQHLAMQMDGIISYTNGNITTRHRVYVERLFKFCVNQKELFKVVDAYIRAFSVYQFPVVKNVNRNEASIFKHLVNAKTLKRILHKKEDILSIYEEYEKIFENEGLFLMQYGLALRSFEEHKPAFEKLRVAHDAFPESPHIEHALAQQRIILACMTDDESIALNHFHEAESALNRLDSGKVVAFDRYPIITLSEGHVRVMSHLGYHNEAKVLAKQYHNRISSSRHRRPNDRLNQTLKDLAKFYTSGKWPEYTQGDFIT